MATHLTSRPQTAAPSREPPAFCPELSDSPATIDCRPPALRGRLRLGATWVILGRTLGIGVTMLLNVALARWLSPEDFGSFLLLNSLFALASLLSMLGLNTAMVRFVSESLGQGDADRARRAMWLVTAVAAVTITSTAGLTALAMSYYGTELLGLPAVPSIVPMVVAGLVLLAMLQLTAEACRSLHEFRLASLFSGGQTGGLLSNILFLMLIAAAMVLSKPSFSMAVKLNLMAMGVCLPMAILGLARAARARLVVTPSRRTKTTLTVNQLLGFSIPMLTIQLLTFGTTQADLWIAGISCPHDQLALYGAARRLMLLVTMPLQMVNLTVISSIAELYAQDRQDDLERILRRATTLAAVPSAGAILVLTLFGGSILELLFGSYFRQAALPLGILGVGQLFLVCAGGCGCALEMTGHQMASLLVTLLTAVAMATIGTWAAVHFGILGLAIASTSIITAQSISMWLLAKRIVGVWTHPNFAPRFFFALTRANQR
jgi:O-antigen/teichoic acid export membrane protein